MREHRGSLIIGMILMVINRLESQAIDLCKRYCEVR